MGFTNPETLHYLAAPSPVGRADQPQARAVPGTERFGFYLVPQFSMLSFAGIIEPLRMANRASGRELYEWSLFAPRDVPVRASNGIPFEPTAPLSEAESVHHFIVVAGIDAHSYSDRKLTQLLKRLARLSVGIGATSTGSVILARAGLLEGYRCTLHWENLDSFREEYPHLQATGELYEIDRKRVTCSGGTAGLDLMLHLVATRHGPALAAAVAEQCIHATIRQAHDQQRMALRHRLKVEHPRLLTVLRLMERNWESALSCEALATSAGLSLRQLERLFREELGTTPARFYLQLRLERARGLLLQTDLSVLEVATACGFLSGSHFTRCYRSRYGRTPRDERRPRR